MYVAKGPMAGPFDASVGGGIAVSRLPWLAALTDIRPGSIAGGGPSRHALSEPDQERLWALFADKPGYYRDGDWPAEFGASWTRDDAARYSPEERARWKGARAVRLSAHTAVPGRGLRLVVVARRDRRSGHANESVKFYLERAGARRADGLRELPGLRWASVTEKGRILVATKDSHLRCLFPKVKGDPETPLRVDQDHDLSGLEPNPKPAPSGAIAPLPR